VDDPDWKSPAKLSQLKESLLKPTTLETVPEEEEVTPAKVTLVEEVVNSIFTPGISGRVLQMMHISFLALMMTLLVLFIFTASWHVVFLLVVNAALWGSITLFVHEMDRQEQLQQSQKQDKQE
jgi:hypothetical protein